MRQYQVPQFIDIEDKVIGPLTVKQALYIGGGVGIIVLARINFEPYLAWPIIFATASFALLLAFAKINERPFPIIVKNAVLFMVRPRLYIWKKRKTESAQKIAMKKEKPGNKKSEPVSVITKMPKPSDSRLSDLAWSLDIKEMWKEKEEDNAK